VTDASTSQPDLTDADGSVDEAPLSDTDVSMADQDVDASLDAETDVEGHPDAGAADAPADVDAGAGADVDGDLDVDLDDRGTGGAGGTGAAGDGGSDEDDDSAESDMDRLENEGDIAADYLEELLDIADLDGDLDMDVEGDRAAVSIVGGDVRQLVGRNGEVLEALQELTRLAVYRETGERSRLMLDVGGFRADKRSRLEKVAAEAVDEVKRSGERKSLEPMSPFERKVVHDVVAAAGLYSSSEGEEPRRYVVVLPA
jgi:spoIIIJ-associated protein